MPITELAMKTATTPDIARYRLKKLQEKLYFIKEE